MNGLIVLDPNRLWLKAKDLLLLELVINLSDCNFYWTKTNVIDILNTLYKFNTNKTLNTNFDPNIRYDFILYEKESILHKLLSSYHLVTDKVIKIDDLPVWKTRKRSINHYGNKAGLPSYASISFKSFILKSVNHSLIIIGDRPYKLYSVFMPFDIESLAEMLTVYYTFSCKNDILAVRLYEKGVKVINPVKRNENMKKIYKNLPTFNQVFKAYFTI